METEPKKIVVSKDKKVKKSKKKEEKEFLLAKVPKVDENGISYTKIQIRRMMKRVKRGLDPVPTEEEERERIKQMRLEKKEEEEELAGMLHTKDKDDDQMDNDGNEKGEEAEAEEVPQKVEEKESTERSGREAVVDEFGRKREGRTEDPNPNQPMKKKRRAKPVPSDYVCMACKNKHAPLHWIYDCPDKIYKPGTNQVSKKTRGIADPSSCKVFVSGLPFEARPKDVEIYFDEKMKCGKVENCKLLMFDDTKRCKGQGFVTFSSEESAKKALKLNGTPLELDCGAQKKKKKDKKAVAPAKKLTLGVKKVLNRRLTQKKVSQ